jgi:hypothetical protein
MTTSGSRRRSCQKSGCGSCSYRCDAAGGTSTQLYLYRKATQVHTNLCSSARVIASLYAHEQPFSHAGRVLLLGPLLVEQRLHSCDRLGFAPACFMLYQTLHDTACCATACRC